MISRGYATGPKLWLFYLVGVSPTAHRLSITLRERAASRPGYYRRSTGLIDVEQITGKYRRRMLAAIVERPLTSDELWDIVYFDDPNGGPMTLKIFSVMKKDINKQIRRLGYVLECELGNGARYRLLTIQDGRRFRKARSMRSLRRRRAQDAAAA